jgi:hypothetical protein
MSWGRKHQIPLESTLITIRHSIQTVVEEEARDLVTPVHKPCKHLFCMVPPSLWTGNIVNNWYFQTKATNNIVNNMFSWFHQVGGPKTRETWYIQSTVTKQLVTSLFFLGSTKSVDRKPCDTLRCSIHSYQQPWQQLVLPGSTGFWKERILIDFY